MDHESEKFGARPGRRRGITVPADVADARSAPFKAEIESLAKFPSENPNPVLRVGSDGLLLYANEASETLLKNWGCAVGETALKTKKQTIADIPQGGRVWSFAVAPIVELGYANLYGRDIAERKQAEEALREHAQLLEYAPVLVRNLQDEIVLWNSGMEMMYGFSREEALGKVSHDLLQTVHPQPVADIRAALLRDGRWEGELQHRHKSGAALAIMSLQILHCAPNGEPQAVIEINTDITRRKAAEEQLERLRSEFYGVISHELKTPLTAIKGSAAMAITARTFPDTNEARELFETISDQCDRLTEMVTNLLDMTRIEAGTFSVDTRETDLAETIADALAIFKRAGYTHQTRVTLPAGLPTVRADRRRIVQVLTNLLTNAAKFSPPGLPIGITAEEQGGQVVVRLRDQGAGITPEKLPLLFQKFSQASRTEGRGTGLGLWISSSIVGAHGGRIWAESEGPDKGSTFSFTLPAFGAVERVEALPVASLRVLAVDDEPSILRFVERFLTVAGHQVVTTTDPFAVRALVEAERRMSFWSK